MTPKNELEKYVEYGVSGTPELKRDEKRHWLGEFRERVVFALTYDQIYRKEAVKIVEEKCKDNRVDKIIVSNKVNQTISGKYMDVAHTYHKDYKTIDLQEEKGEIALVLASQDAVNEKQVLLEKMPSIPEKFYQAKSKKICKAHMDELHKTAPLFVDDFEEISLFDKMLGVKCSVCNGDKK
ncbi:YueI family protein [Clostridiaceae bacterium 35-E11]